MHRCHSEHQNLDPDKKGKGSLMLSDYMNQRDLLLTARYGEGGKGFFHARESPKKREVPFIEALLPPEQIKREVAPPTEFVTIKPRKPKPSSKESVKRPIRTIKKIKLVHKKEPEIEIEKEGETSTERKQRMGFSFLSHLP